MEFISEMPLILIVCYYHHKEYSQVTDLDQENRLSNFYQGQDTLNDEDRERLIESMKTAGKKIV